MEWNHSVPPLPGWDICNISWGPVGSFLQSKSEHLLVIWEGRPSRLPETEIRWSWMLPLENSFGPCPYPARATYHLSGRYLCMRRDRCHTHSPSTIWGSTRAAIHIQLDCPVARQISQRDRRKASTRGASPAFAVAWAAWHGGLGIPDTVQETVTSAIEAPHRGNHWQTFSQNRYNCL